MNYTYKRKTIYHMQGIRIKVRINTTTNLIRIEQNLTVTDPRKLYKQRLHELKVNGCAICGYDKCDISLDFHHSNPKDKKYNINLYRIANKDLTDELNKCVLLCKNCHGEIETLERKNAV